MTKPEDLEPVLELLRQNRGFDFTGYKRATLGRRIDLRMRAVGVSSCAEYADYLEVHQDEFAQLFNTILINVTSFYRDPAAWEVLAKQALPGLLAARGADAPIRVWSAGCASGEEAYTVAMLLAEVLGRDAYVRRVKIYATDVDDDALAGARQAHYSAKAVAALPPGLLEKYFELSGSRYVLDKALRRSVIFGRHDLLHDAPISRIDVLVCRNTIMYFNAETQARVLGRFHFALNEGGILFLGKAEMLLTHRELFVPLDLKRRIFVRGPRGEAHDRPPVVALDADDVEAPSPERLAASSRLRAAAFDTSAVAQLVVDVGGVLAMANDRARSTFGITARDVGRSFHDLEVSYRPVELRSCIEKAYTDRTTLVIKEASRSTAEGDLFYDVHVAPLSQGDGTFMGVDISFFDVTQQRHLREELKSANRELEAAYEELQATSEELETTNEELQSTNEELETTNEELQSTNEELETMNEELQSTNDELQTINTQLRDRSSELNRVNGHLSSILRTVHVAVVVLDSEGQVQLWNRRAEDMWGLRADEVTGKDFLSLDIGLPVESLRAPVRACLTEQKDNEHVMLAATNRRGRKITVNVTCSHLVVAAGEARGVILVMEEEAEASAKTAPTLA